MYVYFATYCSIFSALWMCTCYAGFAVVKAYREAVGIAYGEEALNDGKSSARRVSCLRRVLLILVNRSAIPSTSTSYDDDDDEDDEIDQELMALVDDKGTRYSNIS